MKRRSLIVLFPAVFALGSLQVCGVQSTALGAEKAKDIVDTAVSAGQFKTLAAALKAAGLVETLKGKGPFTVFAPTDEAFAKLPKGTVEGLLKPENKDQLIAILTYHVVPGKVMAKDVVKLKKAKSVQGAEIQVRAKKKRVLVDKAVVTATDIQCSNGVIHVIDSVILPRDIVDTAVAAGQFKTLAAALKAAGLVKTLKGKGPFTVFAPTDEAFGKLPEGTVKELLKPENKDKLTAILTYHVVAGKVMAKDVVKLSSAKTVQGSEVAIKVSDGKVMVDKATVIAPDIVCGNGVVHVIDAVLLPQPMSPLQTRRTLEDAIRRGVPVFNRGDHRQCAEIYTTACQAIVESASDEVPNSVITALKTALDRAKEVHDDRSRAWALRGGIDSALAGLREASHAISSTAEGKERLLFAFDRPEAAAQWRTTNDGVMGGRSDGQFKINEDKHMEFFGTLSLANNGGFASVRSSGSNLGLAKGDSIVARVRGDGREYNLNLYTPTRRSAFAYRAKFETRKGQWIEVRIPLDTFVATSFGRVVRNQQLDPSEVNGLGILLGDKKAGPFKLEVEWIKVAKPSE